MTYWFFKVIGWILPRLPNLLQRYAAIILGELTWLGLSDRRKKKMVEDIRETLALNEDEAVKIGRKSVTRLGGLLTDMAQYPWLTKDNIGRMVRFHGLEHLRDALAKGKGVVMASGHCGNWELLGVALTLAGFPMVAVIRPQKNNGLNRFINEYRSMIPGGTVLTKDDLRQVVKTLGQNKIPLIFIDIDANIHGTWVRFFGRWASTPPGAAVLARLSQAPVVPAFITRAADGLHDIIIHEPVWVDRDSDRDVQTQAVMQQLSGQLEHHIRNHPHEWLWLQERWRTKKPQGE